MSVFRKPLTWLSWQNHRYELVRSRRYLVCDEMGHVAACGWTGEGFILCLDGFDQKLLSEHQKSTIASIVTDSLIERFVKKGITEPDLDFITDVIGDLFSERFRECAPDFSCPSWFMELPAPPGPDFDTTADVPAAIFDNAIGLLQSIERLVMEHEAKRFHDNDEPPTNPKDQT